jgi:DNA-binding NtrC family response regulator
MNPISRVVEPGSGGVRFPGMGRATDIPRVLYVEDDPTSSRLVKAIAEKEGYEIVLAGTEKDCLRMVAEDEPNLFLIDINLPDASGLDLLQKLREKHPAVPAVIVTASDDIQHVITAMRYGAADYLTKPIDTRRMVVSLANAVKLARQEREIARLRVDIEESYSPDRLVGAGPAMDRVRQLVRRAATSDATILITGESGTGKELVARALHAAGPRVSGPFIDVNCAALTETLLESELFGHEKGAFTSAIARRRGKFEQAHGGTLFLDEIGDMPLATQAKILRVLQERCFQRVGGDEKIAVDVRVLCATNRNLEEGAEKGTFRKDLFYRINTLVVEIPPLRERVSDIPELARHFLARTCREEKRSILDFSTTSLEVLCRHGWPGNVRELQHAVHRAVLVCDGEEIQPDHLPHAVLRTLPAAPAGETTKEGLIEAVERLERSMILAALQKAGWVKARAARTLGVTERILSYKMNNLGIERPPQS